MSLNSKNIIIAAATSGIGVEMAGVLSNQGASVFIGGRLAGRGQEVAEKTKTAFTLSMLRTKHPTKRSSRLQNSTLADKQSKILPLECGS